MSETQALGTGQKSRLLRLLDRYLADLESSEGAPAGPVVTPIASALSEYRSGVSSDEWRESIRHEVRPHPLLARLHEDPFSSHGFRKPRGYAGDAVLLDFIYGAGANTGLVETPAAWARLFTVSAWSAPRSSPSGTAGIT